VCPQRSEGGGVKGEMMNALKPFVNAVALHTVHPKSWPDPVPYTIRIRSMYRNIGMKYGMKTTCVLMCIALTKGSQSNIALS
jgi:hypothetical protein